MIQTFINLHMFLCMKNENSTFFNELSDTEGENVCGNYKNFFWGVK